MAQQHDQQSGNEQQSGQGRGLNDQRGGHSTGQRIDNGSEQRIAHGSNAQSEPRDQGTDSGSQPIDARIDARIDQRIDPQDAGPALQGKCVAVLMTDGVEQIEYTSPRSFLEQHGARVILLSPKGAGEAIQGYHHMTPGDVFTVEKCVKEARPNDYDALVLPGGVANPDQLRLSTESIDFIRAFAESDRPIAAICHGPWTLIDAGVAKAKHLTSWPSLQQDLRNAGAEWTDDAVVIDGRLITSRKPDDLPAFNEAMLKELIAGTGSDAGPTS